MKWLPKHEIAYGNIKILSMGLCNESEVEEIYILPEEIIEESYGNGGIFNKNTGVVFGDIDKSIVDLILRCELLFKRNNNNLDKIRSDEEFNDIKKVSSEILRKIDNMKNVEF